MNFFTENSSFASYEYSNNHSLTGRDIGVAIDTAIAAFCGGELVSAGNQFLDIYQIAQNEEQNNLANLITDFTPSNALRIEKLRNLEPYLIRDAALSFYFAKSPFKGIEKKIYAMWPKFGSAVKYGDIPYGEGRSVGEMLKDIKYPLDALLDGSTTTQEVATRLSYYCRVLVTVLDIDGDYLGATECIIGLSLPSNKRARILKSALILSRDKDEKDTIESQWIKSVDK